MSPESIQTTNVNLRYAGVAAGARKFLNTLTVAIVLCLGFHIAAEPAFSQGAARATGNERRIVERMEFRSILAFDGDVQFSLFDPVRGMSFWIRLNETRHGVTVVNYFRENDQIEILYGGHTRRFGLNDAEILPLVSDDEDDDSQDGNGSSTQDTIRRSPQEQMRHIVETWDAQIQQNPQLRNIDEHLTEYYEEFRQIQERMWATTDHDSAEFQSLRERRQDLRDEIQILNDLTQLEIRNDPNFEGINHGSLMGTLRSRHRQQVSE